MLAEGRVSLPKSEIEGIDEISLDEDRLIAITIEGIRGYYEKMDIAAIIKDYFKDHVFIDGSPIPYNIHPKES